MGLKGCWEGFKGTRDTKQLVLATVWCCSHLLFLIPLFPEMQICVCFSFNSIVFCQLQWLFPSFCLVGVEGAVCVGGGRAH